MRLIGIDSRLVAAAAVILTIAPLSAQGSIKDTLVKRDGVRVRGVEVTDATTKEIKFLQDGDEKTLPASEVSAIHWFEPPESFGLAEAAEAKGQFDEAANRYLEAISGTERKPLQDDCRFYGARAAVRAIGTDAAQAEVAETALNGYLEAAPNGFRSIAARILLGRAQRLQGKGAEAEAGLRALADTAVTENWDVTWDARIKFELAGTLLTQGRAADARSTYRSAVSAIDAAAAAGNRDSDLGELKTQCRVAEGESFLAEENYPAALSFFRQHTAVPPPGQDTALAAAAYAGEGQALIAMTKDGDAQGLRNAQVSLATAQVLDAANGETSAKAMYFSGMVLLALGPDHEIDAKSRARSYFDAVIQYYSASPWAARAREALAR